jgi:serine/threonine protein kinase
VGGGLPSGDPGDPRNPTVGSYEILGEIGEGGMGKVYLGRHKLIGRKAAIKILNPDIAADAEVVSRFFTEARAVNDIRHPNIVEVTDFGQFGELHCIVMELLEGETLASRLLRTRFMDEPTVVRIARQVTSALGAAHDRGLVHRDIKPENIFLSNHPDYPDFVKVLDFGIAKLLRTESMLGHQTKTGAVLGTPSYMSPEQCLGETTLDLRSDIYSLGVVLYQMLTGQPPFTAETLGRLIVCHVSERPAPPVTLNPGVSPLMNQVVLRALQKKPKDRFATMKDLREALETIPAAARKGAVAVPVRSVPSGRVADAAKAAAAPLAPLVTPVSPTSWPTPAVPAIPAAAKGPDTTVDLPTPSPAGKDLPSRLVALVLERLHTGTLPLPTLPPATVRCMELLRRSNLGFAEAAQVIGDAASLRSRIMRLANSAAFPSLMPATTLEIAIARLGTEGLHNALIEFSAREVLAGKHPRVKEAFRRGWPHALGVSMIASQLCAQFDRESEASFAYLAGLLADTGRPIVGALLLDIEQQLIRAGNRTLLSEAAWLATIERCHRPVGAALARQWKLAHPVADAIESSGAYEPDRGRTIANVLRFSTALAKRLGLTVGPTNAEQVDAICAEGRRILKIDDGTERTLSHGLKERAIALSAIRGQ